MPRISKLTCVARNTCCCCCCCVVGGCSELGFRFELLGDASPSETVDSGPPADLWLAEGVEEEDRRAQLSEQPAEHEFELVERQRPVLHDGEQHPVEEEPGEQVHQVNDHRVPGEEPVSGPGGERTEHHALGYRLQQDRRRHHGDPQLGPPVNQSSAFTLSSVSQINQLIKTQFTNTN